MCPFDTHSILAYLSTTVRVRMSSFLSSISVCLYLCRLFSLFPSLFPHLLPPPRHEGRFLLPPPLSCSKASQASTAGRPALKVQAQLAQEKKAACFFSQGSMTGELCMEHTGRHEILLRSGGTILFYLCMSFEQRTCKAAMARMCFFSL